MFLAIYSFTNKASAQIAAGYNGDSGILGHPDVIFIEMFEQTSVSDLFLPGQYTSTTNTLNISFDSSVPLGSPGSQSCKLTTFHTPNSAQTSELKKIFATGINDSVFVRYYIKYNNTHTFHHSGMWIGGTNPAYSCWPCCYPSRTIPPGGDSTFQVGTEVGGLVHVSPQSSAKIGFYNYWLDMKPYLTGPNTGKYYGNEFYSPNTNATINMSQWNCVELMLKLNNPVTDSTGELKLWINGILIGHYGKGFPNGTWSNATFNEGVGLPFMGFKWRSNPALMFKYLWLKNYADQNSLNPSANDIWFDHIVVAKNYIGPMGNSVGIKENNLVDEISVYPNPSKDKIFIKTGLQKTEKIIIYNSSGQVEMETDQNEFSTSTMSSGLYFILIQTNSKTHLKKIVIQ